MSGQKQSSEALPVSSLREAIPHLRRPFDPEAIKFKVQTVFKGAAGCLIVAYIDARLVIERLNLVCPDLWHFDTSWDAEHPKFMRCALTVDGVTRADVGESPKGYSKDLFSDALKRAAVHFGVAVSVYALPQITLYAKQAQLLERRPGSKGDTLVLTEKGHEKLRDGYRKWLERDHGFGEPLSHGDVEGQTIDPDVESGEEFMPEPPPALEDDLAEGLKQRARDVYTEIGAIPGGLQAVPPGMFNGWLTGAAHSHGELERLVAHLSKRRDDLAEKAEATA